MPRRRRRSTIRSELGRHRLQLRHRARARRPQSSDRDAARPICTSWTSPRPSIPATVHFRSLSEPSRVSVLEQNYEYDLLEPDKLLRKYVGRDVTLVRTRRTGQRRREEERDRAACSATTTRPSGRSAARSSPACSADHIRFPELPGNLYSRPTLIWTLDNTGGTRHRVEASYLAGKLSWNADYVLTVARDDKAADIDGWVTRRQRQRHVVQERVAAARRRRSEPRRVRSSAAWPTSRCGRTRPKPRRADGAGSVLRLSPLHARPEDDGQQQRDQAGEHARRDGVPGPEALRRRRPGVLLPQRAASRRADQGRRAGVLPVQERREGGLGMPMPAGTVRVYQSDSKGGVQFVGEDRIDHTPKDEALNLKIGNAFDVVCERKQTDFQKIAQQRLRRRVRDHGRATTVAAPVSVEVNEPIGGTWRMRAVVAPVDQDRRRPRSSRCRSQRMERRCSSTRVRVTY